MVLGIWEFFFFFSFFSNVFLECYLGEGGFAGTNGFGSVSFFYALSFLFFSRCFFSSSLLDFYPGGAFADGTSPFPPSFPDFWPDREEKDQLGLKHGEMREFFSFFFLGGGGGGKGVWCLGLGSVRIRRVLV